MTDIWPVIHLIDDKHTILSLHRKSDVDGAWMNDPIADDPNPRMRPMTGDRLADAGAMLDQECLSLTTYLYFVPSGRFSDSNPEVLG